MLAHFGTDEKYRRPEHQYHSSAAFLGAVRGEWTFAIDWLTAMQIWIYPEPDVARVEEELTRWLPTRF
jgi:hypothetical protein